MENPELHPAKMEFTCQLEVWTSEGLDLLIRFDDPLSISQGTTNERLQIQSVSTAYFVSATTGQPLRFEE